MNDKHQENGGLTGPLIFTFPVFSYTGWAAVFVETRDRERDRLQPAQRLLEEPSPKHVPRVVSEPIAAVP
jgi:hypothetical protein